MKLLPEKSYSEVFVGIAVRFPVHEGGRGRRDARSCLAVVKKTSDEFCSIRNKE